MDTLNRSESSFCTASKETGNTGCEKRRRKKKAAKITPNEIERKMNTKKNKINIMYKINGSSYLSSFILARKNKKKRKSYHSETQSTNIIFTLLSKNLTLHALML